MYATYPPRFDREHGLTEADWLSCLPGAMKEQAWRRLGPGEVEVDLPGGHLRIRWQVLEPRRIALMDMPRMAVSYHFDAGVREADRTGFMRYFDLFLRRGGG